VLEVDQIGVTKIKYFPQCDKNFSNAYQIGTKLIPFRARGYN
jgi:hypothetical protein